VIAPDERSFLRELARWDANARWPVLLADPWYCRLFLRAYAPHRVLSAASGGGDEVASPAQAAAAALGPEPLEGIAPASAAETLLARTADGAPGCVLWEPEGGLACAAALLAAGRRQPLAEWAPAGRHADTASPGDLAALSEASGRALDGTGRSWRGLGDALDFVTLASDLPYRCTLAEGFEPGVRALDDTLFRGPDGISQAFVGRLAPDPVEAVYMANCALFLDRRRALLFDTYGSKPPWSDYAFAPAAARLPELGFTEALSVTADKASIGRWLREQREPFCWDQIAVNSSGGFRDWSCGTGGCSDDVTQVGPTFVSYVHSNAAGQPLDPDSIVGRWLALGCYGFFGSVNEPYLQSFLPSSEPIVALAEGWPAALAWRRSPGEAYWCAWRLALLGDPLCGLPCSRTDALPELPLARCEPERDLPPPTTLEQDALAGDWRALAESALASPPATPRERALARSAFLTEMDRATEEGDTARACAMLRAWRALTGEDWALPRLAERLRPLLAGPPETRAAVAECFRALAAAAAAEDVKADLTKRADDAAAAPGA
jgi:hypothetical protein